MLYDKDGVQSKMVPLIKKKKAYAQYSQLWMAGEKAMLWLDNNPLASYSLKQVET